MEHREGCEEEETWEESEGGERAQSDWQADRMSAMLPFSLLRFLIVRCKRGMAPAPGKGKKDDPCAERCAPHHSSRVVSRSFKSDAAAGMMIRKARRGRVCRENGVRGLQ
jgi:hypothetical protein